MRYPLKQISVYVKVYTIVKLLLTVFFSLNSI